MTGDNSSRHRTALDLTLIIAAVLALTLPFIDQAFHIDDREFIAFAEAQLEDPLRFYLEDYDYAGRHYEVFRTTHPPLLSSLIAVVIWLYGSVSEVVLHSVYLFFPILAAVSMYFLSRRFCPHPFAATLLLLTAAGFLVMSHTIMGDVPALAFWLAAIAVFVHGLDNDSRIMLVGAAALISLAVLTAYQSLSLLPLLFLYMATRRRFSLAGVTALIVPLAVFLVLALYMWIASDGLPRFSYGVGLVAGWDDIDGKFRALLVFLGAAFIFPLFIVPALVRRRHDVMVTSLLALALIALGLMIPVARGTLDTMTALLMAIPLVAGVAAVYHAVVQVSGAIKKRLQLDGAGADDFFLSVWLLGIAFYVLVFLPFVSVRHMIPLATPLILLVVRGIHSLWPSRDALRKGYLGAAVALSLAVALAAAVSDYRLAGSYRAQAEKLSGQFSGAGETVWFLGEFGFRYYMEREGFPYLGASAVAEPGDIVVRSTLSSTSGFNVIVPPPPEAFSQVTGKYPVEDAFPVRLRNPRADAGFYNYLIGPMPFMPSREPVDDYTIYRLEW